MHRSTLLRMLALVAIAVGGFLGLTLQGAGCAQPTPAQVSHKLLCAGKYCSAGLLCDPFVGACVPAVEFCSQISCGIGQACNYSTGQCEDVSVVPNPCDGLGCDPGYICNPVTVLCDLPCTLGAGKSYKCHPTEQSCDVNTGKCTEYDASLYQQCQSAPCPPGQKCELGHARSMEAAVTALEEGKLDKAIGLLRSIPGSAMDHPKAQFLLASSKTIRRNAALEGVRARLIAGDADGARTALEGLISIAPENMDAMALKAMIDGDVKELPVSAQSATSRKSPKTGKASSGARKKADTARSDRKRTASKSDGKGTDRAKRAGRSSKAGSAAGMAAYRSGKFSRAAEMLEAAAGRASGENAASLRDMARTVKKFEKQYTRGKSGGSLAASTKPLERAYRADQKLGGHFAAELKPLLADKYAKRAAEAYSRQVYGSAAIFARKALEYDARHMNASGVLKKTQSKGKGMYDKAVQARTSGNDASAEVLFRQVLKILPSSDPLQRKARKALEERQR